MTMTYFVWQNNYNVDNDLRALNRGQGLRFAYTFLTKRRREKLYDSFGVSEIRGFYRPLILYVCMRDEAVFLYIITK